MTTANPADGNLAREIRAFQQRVLPTLPQGVADLLASTTEDLVRSGIAAGALKEGDRAPDFTLANVRGEPVRLATLLARGPAVVTFYRGGW